MFGGILAGAAAILAFCALFTAKITYAVWLGIYTVWLGIYAVSVCHVFGRGFQAGHVSYAFFIRRKSPPHLWN
jgi:hypothetical protein